jgi:hypothetical protein
LNPVRAAALALTVLALLALVFFWPVTFNQGWIPRGGGDLVSFLWPTYSYAAQSLHAGRIPLWNPTLYSGAPFVADNQSGVFYPLNLLAFLLAPSLPYRALEWLVVIHVWLAGVNMYLLLRVLLAPPASGAQLPALFSAIAYMFSDVFITHIGNLNIVAVAAWLPLALAGVYLAFTRRSLRWAISAGLVLGVAALAGHAQTMLMVFGAVGLFGGWQMAASRGLWLGLRSKTIIRDLLWGLGRVALIFLVAIGLSALALFPAIEITPFTGRARLDYAAASEYSLPWAGLAGLFSPLLFGRGAANFWGPWPRVELGYLGVLPLLFAGLAPFRTRRGLTFFFGALAVFGLLVALGANTPFHRLLYDVVPGFAQLRVPARFILLTDFALAVLGGLGLNELITIKASDTWGRRWAITLLIGAPLVLWLAHCRVAAGPEHDSNLWWAMGVTIAMLLCSLLLIISNPLRPFAPTLALLLLSADLLGHGAWVEVEPNDPTTGFAPSPALAYVQSQPGPTRIDNVAGAWSPDLAARFGLEDIDGLSNPLALAGYQTYLGAMGERGSLLYDFLNAQFIIAEKGRPPAADPAIVPVHNEDPAVDVYLNTEAMPRVNLIYSSVVVTRGEAAFGAIHAPGFDPRTTVVIENGPALNGPSPRGESNLYYLDYRPEAFTVVALTPGPAYLVFSEVWYPGWRAWVDGVETPIYKANFAFRAVYLNVAGEHTVTMRFESLSWKIGLGLTTLTLLGCFAFGVWAIRKVR